MEFLYVLVLNLHAVEDKKRFGLRVNVFFVPMVKAPNRKEPAHRMLEWLVKSHSGRRRRREDLWPDSWFVDGTDGCGGGEGGQWSPLEASGGHQLVLRPPEFFRFQQNPAQHIKPTLLPGQSQQSPTILGNRKRGTMKIDNEFLTELISRLIKYH